MRTRKPKPPRTKTAAERAADELRLKDGEDAFVEDLDDPDEDYARGVEEVARSVRPEAPG